MRGRTLPGETAADFAQAIEGLRAARLRPEVRLTEVPAPQRIAPYAVALTGEVVGSIGDEELASGRFVLLHDLADGFKGFGQGVIKAHGFLQDPGHRYARHGLAMAQDRSGFQGCKRARRSALMR